MLPPQSFEPVLLHLRAFYELTERLSKTLLTVSQLEISYSWNEIRLFAFVTSSNLP
jgi:hypothetical protein